MMQTKIFSVLLAFFLFVPIVFLKAQDFIFKHEQNGINIAIFTYIQKSNDHILLSLLLHSEQEIGKDWACRTWIDAKEQILETNFREEKDCKNMYRILCKVPIHQFSEMEFYEKNNQLRFKLKLPFVLQSKDIRPVFFFDSAQYPIISYIKPLQKIYQKTDAAEVYVYPFNEQFAAAAPPMSNNFGSSKENLMPLETITRKKGEKESFSFPKENYFLFVQSDTSSFDGQAIFVGSEDFPKYNKAENLLKPSIYIAEENEYLNNLRNKNARQAFENFWLSISKNAENVALERIRTYYRRVELANKIFSFNKAGWMTDLGMIFVIYGLPDKVFYQQESNMVNLQVWQYDFSNTTFYFEQKGVRMGVPIWVLKRSKTYSKTWSNAIDTWRK